RPDAAHKTHLQQVPSRSARRNRMSRTLLTLIVSVLVAAPAAAAEEKFVKLIQADTGKAVAVADDSDDAGARVVLAKEGDGKSQQWKFVKDGSHYKIVNRKSGKVLDVAGESTEEGDSIIQWDDKDQGTDNQR